MGKQLDYVTCKERHYELWDFVVNEIKAVKALSLYIPRIDKVKREFFAMKGYKIVPDLCFACYVAEVRFMSGTEICHRCYVCPLEIDCCLNKTSPFMKLRGLEGTMDYDKAIGLAEEIRDSWSD